MPKKPINFVCPKCGAVIPTSLIKRLLSPHKEKTMWRSKCTQLYLKCTNCGERSWMKQEQLLKEERAAKG